MKESTRSGFLSDENRIISIFIPFEPIAKGRPRFSRSGHAYTPGRTRSAETRLREFLRQEFDSSGEIPFKGPIGVSINFVLTRPKSSRRSFPTVRPDLDNQQKLPLDCGNEIIWDDDCQICELTARKRYAEPGARSGYSVLRVWPLPYSESDARVVSLGRLGETDQASPNASPEVSNPSQDSSEVVSTQKRKRKKSQQVQE